MTRPTRAVEHPHRSGRGHRWLGSGLIARVVGVGFTLAVALVWLASPAQAHATLLFTSPAADGAVASSPTEIQLVFDQPVIPAGTAVTLSGPDGEVRVAGPTSGENGRTITVPVLENLEVGEYLVEWEATGGDGDTMAAEYRFGVGSTAGLAFAGGSVQTRGAPAVTVLRWALFVGLSLMLGGFAGSRLVRRTAVPVPDGGIEPGPWLLAGALVGLVSAAGLAVLYLGDGALPSSVDQLDLERLLAAGPGRLAGIELAVLVAAALTLAIRRLPGIAAAAALTVAVAEGFRAHPQAAEPGWGSVLTTVHLVAAAVWVGALVHVLRIARWRSVHGQRAAPVVRAYARLALWLFLTVVTAGTLSVLVMVDPSELLATLRDTAYGRWLLAKLVLVAVVAGLAWWARWHLVSRPGRRQPAPVARVEAAALVGVLAVSGALTALAPPAAGDLPLPFPPRANGPVVAVGARTGWIGIGLSASAGQLVVRLSTPDMGERGQQETDADRSALTGRIGGSRAGNATSLSFRRCGDGCFVAPVAWTPGRHLVTLQAGSKEWQGGTARVTIPWPPQPRPGLLQRVAQAMREVPSLTVNERVTSDTSQGLGKMMRLPMSGREYLEVGPYGSGMAPIVTLMDTDGSKTTLALGYPAEANYLQLTIDARFRIIREVIAAHGHLVTRTLDYPDRRGGGR